MCIDFCLYMLLSIIVLRKQKSASAGQTKNRESDKKIVIGASLVLFAVEFEALERPDIFVVQRSPKMPG